MRAFDAAGVTAVASCAAWAVVPILAASVPAAAAEAVVVASLLAAREPVWAAVVAARAWQLTVRPFPCSA